MADFVLGRLKFHYVGDWTTSYSYIKDDVVTYGGNSFVCLVNHTSAADFYTDLNHSTAKWQKMVGGQDYKNNWAATTLYKIDDIVTYGGSTYRCNTGHTSQADLYDDEAKWTKFVPGFKFRGEYASGMQLRNDDVVRYGGNLYITTAQHTAASNVMDLNNFDLFVQGLQFEDSWSSSSYYQLGDVVTYGGYSYVAKRQNNNVVPYNNTSDWEVLTTGFKTQGVWSNATAYKTGDTVSHGGHYYVAKIDNTNVEPTGATTATWEKIVEGLNFRDVWATSTAYRPGDLVNYGSSSYRAKQNHTSGTSNRPDNDSAGLYWDLIAEGDSNFVLTNAGDLLTRNATQNVRLPVGLSGQVLKVNSAGTGVEWGYSNVNTNVYYVSTDGVDDTVTGRGTSPDKPWRTIKYACTQTAGVSGNKTINVATGTYSEQLPIVVARNTSIIGDNLRSVRVGPDTVNDNGYGAGISDDGSTPNNRSDMFRVNNSTTFAGMTFVNMVGQLQSSASADGLYRPTVATGTTRSGVIFALDPGTGPSDSTKWIVSQSPFIQNCTHIGSGSIGIKIDGSLHNGGYKSILANDFTQVTDDGIGVWALNRSRSELVSVFTYYCHMGYLADSGAIIRSLNSNNSYGEYGSVSSGVDPNETPYTGTVNNRENEATVGRVLISNAGAYRVEQEYTGETYTSASIAFSGSGANAAATAVINDGGVKHVTVTNTGAGHFTTTGTAQTGTLTSITLALSDSQPTGFYNGMRITITSGTGSGQTGYIGTYNSLTKIATVFKEDTTSGWDVFGPTVTAVSPNATATYEIEPRVTFTGGGSPTRVARARAVIENQQVAKILIIDAGEGYASVPAVSITDPNATTLGTATAEIGDGVIAYWNITGAGSGYKQENTTATVTGDGYAEILPVGAVVKLTGVPNRPKPGSIVQFANDSVNSYYIVTVLTHTSGGLTSLEISPNTTLAVAPPHNTTATFRENYSNIRLTGHDFLDIGTGGIADTNYPGAEAQDPDQADEVIEVDRGRVFYTSTDQDGNFRVGELFRVEQSTGKATLNAEAFDLSGLRELSLGSVALGNFGATINEFSTDATLGDNSDTALVTERAIRTFVENQLGGGQNNLTVNSAVIGNISISGNNISATSGQPTFTTLPTTALTPTTDGDLTRKAYVDAQVTPTLQMISFDRDTGRLNRKVVTNYGAVSQFEDTIYNAMEEVSGYDVINGTMRINVDKGGNLVLQTENETSTGVGAPSNQ